MRHLVCGLALLATLDAAAAADYLRGSTVETAPRASYDWSGIYIGAQAGYTGTDFDFTKGTSDLVADILRQTTIEQEAQVSTWPRLPWQDARGSSFGGFVGYNSQWGDVVLGLELNYNRVGVSAAASDSISRRHTTQDEFEYAVTVDSSASARLTDYGTLRARAGYAWGWIMPYATLGVAMGRADITRAATVGMSWTDMSTSARDLTDGIAPRAGGSSTESRSETKNGAMTYGYAAGLGVDIGLFPGVFLRGEYEFVQLGAMAGIKMHINTFRAAAAVKF